MAELQVRQEEGGARLVWKVMGVFGEDAARDVVERIREAPPLEAIVDLRLALEVSDVALATLAELVDRSPATVVVLGLRTRHERMLECLGFALDEAHRLGRVHDEAPLPH